MNDRVEAAWTLAKERYREEGVDAEAAIETLASVSLSLHCWQGDDVRGFEGAGDLTDGGIAATGNHPGRARNAHELRSDLDAAYRGAPPEVPAAVIAWLASEPEAAELAGKTIDAQRLCRERNLLPGWPA